MCHLKALNYPTHLMYMLNFMCNYENQFLSTNVDVIIIFITILLLFTLFTSFSKFIYSCRDNTMISKCEKSLPKLI